MSCKLRGYLQIMLLLAASLLLISTAKAHFNLNLNVRIIHVEHQSDGLNIYMRLPMPYLVAHLLGEKGTDGLLADRKPLTESLSSIPPVLLSAFPGSRNRNSSFRPCPGHPAPR